MFSHAEVSKLDNPRSINKEISTFDIPDDINKYRETNMLKASTSGKIFTKIDYSNIVTLPMDCLFIVQISQPRQNVTSKIANNRFCHGTAAMITDIFVY